MSCWTFLEASAIVLGLVGRVEKKERKKFMGLVSEWGDDGASGN